MRSVVRAVCVALVAVTVAACAGKRIGKPVVWPSAPEKARIRFVTAFRHTIDLDTSGWARFKRGLFGGSNDPALAQPMGLAISDDGRRLYITDYGQSAVFVANFSAKTLKRFAPDEPMGRAFAIALDAEENVYVTDSSGKEVVVYSRRGEKLRTIGKGDFERPTGIALDRKRGLLYVADSASLRSENHRVKVYKLDGTFVRDLGPPGGLPGGRGEGDGQFYFPTYLALDGDGNLHVADTMNFRIQVFGPDGQFIRKYGENGDGPGYFARIKGMAFDSFGNLYVVDGGHANVQIFNRDFAVLMFFGGYAKRVEYFDVPSGIAIDPRTNRIYVCNEFISRINVYELINTTAEDSYAKPTATR